MDTHRLVDEKVGRHGAVVKRPAVTRRSGLLADNSRRCESALTRPMSGHEAGCHAIGILHWSDVGPGKPTGAFCACGDWSGEGLRFLDERSAFAGAAHSAVRIVGIGANDHVISMHLD